MVLMSDALEPITLKELLVPGGVVELSVMPVPVVEKLMEPYVPTPDAKVVERPVAEPAEAVKTTDETKSRSTLFRTSLAAATGAGEKFTPALFVARGCVVKTSCVAVTSILLLSPVVEEVAPPASPAANLELLPVVAVAEVMAKEIGRLSVTKVLKLTRTVKDVEPLSAAVRESPKKLTVAEDTVCSVPAISLVPAAS